MATNSLELGIDIGKLDTVVLIQSPRSISSAVQRIGRAGHGVGEVSRGVLFPTHGMDFLNAAVMAQAVMDREVEALRPVEAPLDVLVQIILSMAHAEEWNLDELYSFLRTSYPYRDLSRKHFDLVVAMLEGRYADSHVSDLRPRATVDRITNTIRAKEGASALIFMEGGTIPDRGYFDLRVQDTGAKIGELDEEFVWERKIGDTFSLGTQVWQIKAITHNNVEVVPARKPHQIIPFWKAEEIDRDFFYSEKIAAFLETANARLDDPGFPGELKRQYAMTADAAEALAGFLKRQKEAANSDLPHRHHLLIEHFHDTLNHPGAKQVILHTLWGNSINRPFTFALAAAWQKKYGYPLQAFYTNDAIALILPHEFEMRHLFSLVTPENLEALLRSSLESTGYFGARFRENAGRALLLPKMNFKRRMPLWFTRLRSKKLLGSTLKYRDFPILIETWRSCLQDDFDLPDLKRLLDEIQEGQIRLSESRTTVASPFAEGLIWYQTNKYMYEDDTPESAKVSQLGADLIRELVYSSHLRPRLPEALVKVFERKRQRTAEGYSPDSGRELIDWVKERLLVPAQEWQDLLDAITRDHDIPHDDLLAQIADRIVFINVPGADPLACAIEKLPEIVQGLGKTGSEISISPVVENAEVTDAVSRLVEDIFGRRTVQGAGSDSEDEEPGSIRLLSQWLSFYGPVELVHIERLLAMEKNLFEDAIRTLEETGQIVLDRFMEESRADEICDSSNLETLLRIFRRSRQPSFEALDIENLPLFLAGFQGLTKRTDSIEDLQNRLEQLFGFPLPANVWEEEVLPARLGPYFTAWLDSLMHTSELLWFGCGEEKVSFAFPRDLGLFRERTDGGDGSGNGRIGELIPDAHGRYSLATIQSLSGLPPESVSDRIWHSVWKGELSNDSFVTVRNGILTRFKYHPTPEPKPPRRIPADRWVKGRRTSGNWFLLDEGEDPSDILETEELQKERVRVLLDRYGILFRELLSRELPALQWQKLFRTLRIMELSGEVLSGNFFNGIPGLQFISHEAYRMLVKGLPSDAVYWLNALDPACLCGTGLEAHRAGLPPRTPSTHIVYHGPKTVIVSRRYGKELTINAAPDHPRMNEYLSFFKVLVSRDFNPRKHILVEKINDTPARESEYLKAFKEFGFQESYKGLELWKGY